MEIKWMQRLNATVGIEAKQSGGRISPQVADAALGAMPRRRIRCRGWNSAVMRKRWIDGSSSEVRRFYKRHNVSFKKKPARSERASWCGCPRDR